MLLANVMLWAIAIFLLVPVGTLLIECMAAILPSRSVKPLSQVSRPSVAVLVPAHNEQAGIQPTLAQILPQLTRQDRLLVIADNCTDETATVARAAGATVVERHDPERRGKGYALDFGLRHLDRNPPDVVVMIDADCNVQSGCIEQIALLSRRTDRPVQALYLMEQPPTPSPKDSVSALAFLFKNLVRPTGLQQLRQPCLLTGTGMAFPWQLIRNSPLASGNIVEDMQLGLDLAIAGSAPMFCPTARVIGRLPQQAQAAKSQRTRWEHGHLQTLITQAPRLLKAAMVQLRVDLLALAIDLAIPPLSLLVMLWIAATAIAALGALFGASDIPLLLLIAQGVFMLLSIVVGWLKFGQQDIPLLTLLSVPLYLLWKIPMYFKFLTRPQNNWVRTERDPADVPKP